MIDEVVWKSGEEMAAKYMKGLGYKIITTNYQQRGFELDIVAVLSRRQQLKKIREEFKQKLSEYIFYYNTKRIKNKFKMSPIEYKNMDYKKAKIKLCALS